MVIGGEKENLSQVESVELVSTDPNLYPVPDCLTELSVPEDTPWGRVGAAGGLNYGRKFMPLQQIFQFDQAQMLSPLVAEGGLPYFCGGKNYDTDVSNCYQYLAAVDEWIFTGQLGTEGRSFMGYGSSQSGTLFLAGGRDYFGPVADVTATDDPPSFRSLPGMNMFSDV